MNLSNVEAMKALKISPRTLMRWRNPKRPTIKPLTFQRDWNTLEISFDSSELFEWVKENKPRHLSDLKDYLKRCGDQK